MKRIRKPARSLETALEIVETGIEKIVAGLREPAPSEARPNRARPPRAKAHAGNAQKAHATV